MSSHEVPHFDADGPLQVLWHDVTSGKFRIADWYDRDGRRYIVARRASRTRFTARQRKALKLRAAGVALKVIALELDISIASACREIRLGMDALGLQSTAALTAVLGHAGA